MPKGIYKHKPCSDKTKKKISKANKGKIIPKRLLNLYRTGKTPWNKGIKMPPMSKETRKKMSESHRGEKSYLWKGGIMKLRFDFRRSFEYRLWRSDVFQRDDWTCQECGERGGKLHAHHINSFSNIIRENNIKTWIEAKNCEELWNINNGITLCINCHKKTDSYGCPKK